MVCLLGASRERLKRKAHSAVLSGAEGRARTCSGKRDPRLCEGHAHISTPLDVTSLMCHRVHQFRNTFPLVMIDCNRSSVLRCIEFEEGLPLQVQPCFAEAASRRRSRYCSPTAGMLAFTWLLCFRFSFASWSMSSAARSFDVSPPLACSARSWHGTP